MSVHYKFKSALSFDTITFDGLHISIRDLKKAILQQKQIGKASDFDLQITNAQSNEVYDDDNTLVPKNSSLIVVRIPLTTQQKKAWEKSDALPVLGNKAVGDLLDPYATKLAKTVDLANVEASEADKIQAAITQSTLDYDPSNYLRIKGSNQVGELPAQYRCFKCNLPGHWIKDCKNTLGPPDTNAGDIKKSTGIPQSFMVPVEGPRVPGAMMTPTGHYAVPSIEHQARKEPLRKVTDPLPVEKPSIPDDLICGVCKDLLADAVLIPCCGNSFCDECIRNVLLESEDHQCPDCREKDVSPDTLIPNRFLRNSVSNFRNQTGYCRTAPSFLQSKMAAAAAEAAAAASHIDPSLAHAPVDEIHAVQHSQHPTRMSPVESAKDRPPSRKSMHSPDDVQIVEETQPIVVAPIAAIGMDDASIIAPPGESLVGLGQPILNIGTTTQAKPGKHYDIDDNYHHKRSFKHSFRIRHERSDTPTVDERSQSVESFQAQPIESIGQPPSLSQPPRMFLHNQRPPPPHMYPQGSYMYRPNFPHPPPRHDLSATYPPGVDHHPPPRMNMNYRGNSYYPPRAPRAPYRPPHSTNGPPHISATPIDDPLEVFNRLLREKDLGRARDRGRPPRRRSPSFGRSYSRSTSPRPRSRPPRSRSRSSTRLRSRSPRSRSPPPRSRSRSNVRRRSRSRSFSISSRSRSPIPPRSRSPRSMRSYHSRSPSRDRDRHYSPLPPVPRGGRREDRRPERSPRHSPVRYYSQRYKEEYGGAPPPKGDRGESRPIERLDRDRVDRDRGRRFNKPSSVVQEYYSSSQDFNRHVPPERYDSKDSREPRFLERPRERDRDFEKDRDRDRDRGVFKRERIPSLLDEPAVAPRRTYDREAYDRIASDWEKTRDRELQLQERERERQAALNTSTAPPAAEYYHSEKSSHIKKRESVRPVEPILGVRREEPHLVHDDRERDLTYVQARDSPLIEVPVTSNKSPEKEKKSKDKKKKKSKEESDKKKKKKKVKEKTDKKDSSEQEVSSSIPAVEEGEDESKQSEDVPVREDPLYGDLAANSDIVDIGVVESYTKVPTEVAKEPVKEKDVVLAPVPELSKWEKDDEPFSQSEERAQENGSESKQVTSEVIKRAENAIFKKSINPIHDKKSDRRTEVKKSSKEKDKLPTKDILPLTKEKEVVKEERVKEERVKEERVKEERVKEEKVKEERVKEEKVVELAERSKEKDAAKAVHAEKEVSPRRERPDRRDERERRDDRDRYRERREREQEREREDRYRLKMIERERERERHLVSSREAERERFALTSKGEGFERAKASAERKISETIPLRISAKDRLGAKVDDKVVVKKRLERREVKAEKVSSKRKERLDDKEGGHFVDKKKHVDEGRFVTSFDKVDMETKKEASSKDLEVILISQSAAVDPPGVITKKRSVSLDAERLVKKIKLAQGEASTADSSPSSDESVSVKKHKKKKKKKHKKKKKKKKHSSSDSDSSDSSSDSETEKKRKHKKSKKSKKRKKSKK